MGCIPSGDSDLTVSEGVKKKTGTRQTSRLQSHWVLGTGWDQGFKNHLWGFSVPLGNAGVSFNSRTLTLYTVHIGDNSNN